MGRSPLAVLLVERRHETERPGFKPRPFLIEQKNGKKWMGVHFFPEAISREVASSSKPARER
jgi:hypothetical protein